MSNYKDYHVYDLRIKLLNVEGELKLKQVNFLVNDEYDHSFPTNVRLSDETQKEFHLYSGNGSAAIIYSGFKTVGYEAILSTKQDIMITDVIFEGTEDFNLTDYIEKVSINNQELNNQVSLNKSEVFSILIEFKDETPEDIAIIDQVIIKYKESEDGEVKEAYALVPIQFYFTIAIAESYIDLNLVNENE